MLAKRQEVSRETLKIGSLLIDPPILQAPMAGFSNYAYREMVRRLGGAGLLVTEMVSARAFLEIDARGNRLPDRLWGVKEEPRPLAVQIWDNNPASLAAVGRRLTREFEVSVVDINFGCPVREISEKARSGSYLLQYPDQVGEIVGRVVEACHPVPVTAKIRLGTTRERITAVEVARAVESAGGAALTVHGRTAAEKFGGSADWDAIARIKPHLRRIPLIGNGDVRTAEDVVEAFLRYGVDGVMIGRAALARPWLFCQARAALRGEPVPPEPTLAQQRQLLLDHYDLVVKRFGAERATILMRRFACNYARGCRGARRFRTHAGRAGTAQEFRAVVEEHFPRDEV